MSTPAAAAEFARGARQNGFGVLICAAGMAAHLAGAFAGNSTLPVIGIPMKGGAMDGLDALLATVQMPGALIQIGDRSDEIGVAERAARAVQIVRLRRTPQLLSSIS